MAKPQKPMKRLPLNWAEKLTKDDINSIIEHFRWCEANYQATIDQSFDSKDDEVMERCLVRVRERIRRWVSIAAAKDRGEKIQPLVNLMVQTG